MFSYSKYFRTHCNLLKTYRIFDCCFNDFMFGSKSLKTSSHFLINKIFKDIDIKNFKKYVRAPTLSDAKQEFEEIVEQFTLLYEECKEGYEKANSMDSEAHNPDAIDMIFKFESEEEFKKFVVVSDSSYNQGYSSASLKFTESKTALFTGNICTTVPKDGELKFTGYASMMTKPEKKSFYREKCFDWGDYSHIVLKVRGDGRTYVVALPCPINEDVNRKQIFRHPLYTRGGPYWQIVKIPFNHFCLTSSGRILSYQYPVLRRCVTKFGINLRDGVDGPFKLEIDYVGLQADRFYRNITAYEEYLVP